MKAQPLVSRPLRATRLLLLALLGLLALALPRAGQAATASTTFNVTATVLATCTISASNVAFGTYGSAQTDATGTLTINCTNLATYTLALDAGGGSSATVAARKMTNTLTSSTLTYALYRDAARTLVWGDTGGTNTLPGVGIGGTQSVTVYGRIPATQYPEIGTYSDTVTATITY